jgi:formylmethanofuran dehydrogenase subunit C
MKKDIPFDKAFEILNDCRAIEIDNFVVEPRINADASFPFLELEWHNNIGQVYELSFDSGDNDSVQIDGDIMYLKDTNGDINEISILIKQNLSLDCVA